MVSNSKHKFIESRKKQLEGLLNLGVFEIVPISDVPGGMRIYDLRWVDVLKKDYKGDEYENSRVVGKNFRDINSEELPTKAPTFSKMGQRFGLSITCQNKFSYLRDIVQAYVQSLTFLERLLYYYPLPEMEVSQGYVLRALKPIYGAPESGLHWFVPYSSNHIKKLVMEQTSTDHAFCISVQFQNQSIW